MVPTGSRYSTNWCRTLEDDKWLEVKKMLIILTYVTGNGVSAVALGRFVFL